METNVSVIFPDKAVYVDGKVLVFDSIPLIDDYPTANALQWHSGHGDIEIPNEQNVKFTTEDDYVTFVQPYVDLFTTETSKIQAEYDKVENVRYRALSRLRVSVDNLLSTGHTTSSVGFEINTDTSAYRNIDCLLLGIADSDDAEVEFMTYQNTIMTVSVSDLKIIKTEIAEFISDAYRKKWRIRELINNAATKEDIESISWDANLNIA